MELKICHMYPDVLNLYGDRGNINCIARRLRWRGIDAEITRLPIGESAALSRFDLVFIGGGQDFEQQVLLDDLHRGKDREIRAAVEDGLTFLTTRLLDQADIWCPTACNPLNFKVKGPGELVATDAGDPTSHTPFHSADIDAFNGLCSTIVRRTGPGEITVSVSAKGLTSSKITL